jgi:hypothetical protein
MEDCRTARQVAEWNPQGKGGAAEQSIHGRMRLGTVCKEETSRMKNIPFENSEGRNYDSGFKKTVYSRKNSFNHNLGCSTEMVTHEHRLYHSKYNFRIQHQNYHRIPTPFIQQFIV